MNRRLTRRAAAHARRCGSHAAVAAGPARAPAAAAQRRTANGERQGRPQLLELAAYYIDVDREDARERPDDARAVHRRRRGSRSTTIEDINDNAGVLREDPGRALRGGRHRSRHHRDRPTTTRFLGAVHDKGWVAEARQEPHPEHLEPRSTRRRARRSTRTASTRCRGTRAWTGIAWNEDLTRPGDDRARSCSRTRS